MSSKIFVPFTLSPDLAKKIEEAIAGSQLSLSMLPQDLGKAEQNAFARREMAETEIYYGGFLPQDQFEAAPNLKWIQVPFAGVNHLLSYPQITESEVIVTNSAGVMAPGLADQIMAYVLLFSRKLLPQIKAQERRSWERTHGQIELVGSTLGIIGHGNIGRETAKRAKGFGMRVIATKNNTAGEYPELDEILPSSELERLLIESDFVVMCAPLTPETEGMLGRAEFEKMKPTAYFINIARGQVVKEAEMIEALQEKQIAGAALDVFDKEPLPTDSPLWAMDNVIITPHSSGNFEGFMLRSVELFCQNLSRYLKGEPLINLVDKKRGY